MYMEIINIVLTVMLGVVAYFLRQIHLDFRELKTSVAELVTKVAVGEEHMKNIDRVTNDRLASLDKRIERLEDIRS